jgi:hypothetical protein
VVEKESAPVVRSKKEFMMQLSKPSTNPNCMATLCPVAAKRPKAENILKTKGQKRAFSPNEAENILKRKPLTKNCRNPKKA